MQRQAQPQNLQTKQHLTFPSKVQVQKLHQRLVSLFSFYFKSQERSDQNNEILQKKQQVRRTELILKLLIFKVHLPLLI
jgi:hypothetical protein